MKKYVRYLLVLLMCSSLTGVKAQTTFPFDGIRYCLDGSEAQVFDGRYYSESKLIIPNSVWYNGIKYPVTSIRYHAFYECKSLTEVTIPNSVTTIGNGAFDSCTGLQKVIWNARNADYYNGLSYDSPFSNCDRLTDFVFGEEVEYIPDYLCFQLTSLKKLVIGNSVTTIGMWAFYECTGLTEVTISNSVTTIGYKAFDGCTGLQKVIWNARNAQDLQYVYDNPIFPDCNQLTDFVFGEEVEHIPDFLCNNLRLLNTIVIPNSVTTIGDGAFNSCTGLTEVTIPNSVTSIGSSAFSGCTGLTEVTIPNSVTTIGNGAFSGCTGLTEVTIPNSVTSIGSSAFSGCTGLTTMSIGNSVTAIGERAFSGCTGLTEVTILNSVTTIGNGAFNSCTGLTEVTIPNSVTTIGDGAFDSCTGLQKVIWNARNAQDLQDVLYDNPIFPDCDQLTDFVFGEEVEHIPGHLCYKLRLLNTIIIPNSVTAIGERAFSGCTGLTTMSIGNSVTAIGERAFYNCSGLQTVIWNARNVQDLQYDVFNNILPFSGCDRLTDFVFGEEVEYIPDYLCYQLTSLKKLVIGNSVTTIGKWAFYECTGLQKVTIGNSVTAIGYGAFYSCTGLTEVIWNARNAQDFQDNSSPFSGCDRLTDFVFGEKVEHIPAYLCYQLASLKKLVIGNSVTSIGKMAFSSCTGLTEVTIPNSVTSIGSSAFSGCTGLTEVTIPNSVTSIGYLAFSGCTGLQKVIWNTRNAQCLQDKFIWSPFKNCDRLTDFIFGEEVEHIPAYLCYNLTLLNTIVIPNSVTTIGYGAFSECRGLQKVTIGNSVTTIGKFAFTSCRGLQKVTIGNSVTAIGYGAFDSCSGLTEITIPNAVTTIGVWAFSSCTGLTEVTIPNSVTTIEGYAFTRCTGLKTVTIGNSVTTIEDGAFNGCTQMESVTIGEKVESIGESAFAKCNNLTAVISKAMTPPQIWATTFDDYAMTLYVPAGCKPKYAEAEYWNNFTDIRETGVTLHTVTANATDETMGYVTGGGEYPQGSTATLIAVPFGQNYFVRWNDGNTDNPRTITVTGDMTFTAEFAPAGSAVETLENGERGIYATGRTLHVENGGESYRVYTAAGRLVYTGNDSSVTLSAPGMYIVHTGDRSQKVAVK